MKKMKKFYLTTSIAYTNSSPHLGFALELVQADVIARYQRLLGKKVYFSTGTDEHGLKIEKIAQEKGLSPKEFVDEIVFQYQELTKKLNISQDDFIRTTDEKRHIPAVKKAWRILLKNGDLYKKRYQGYYCVGCEAFWLEKDLQGKKCPIHQQECVLVEEENYFFRLSRYQEKLLKVLSQEKIKIYPQSKKKEVITLIKKGLPDISFSRDRKKLNWGIEVPNDQTQVIYVWCDALINYLSTIGYSNNLKKFNTFWPADLHCVGKDILKFHSLIWPAMLMSLKLPLPRAIFVHGFLTINGQKISKSLGNVIDPFYLIKKYNSECLRYYLIKEIPTFNDGDFSEEKLIQRYNTELADGLGNLVSRLFALSSAYKEGFILKPTKNELTEKSKKIIAKYQEKMENYALEEAISILWQLVKENNRYLNSEKPWAKNEGEKKKILTNSLGLLFLTLKWLSPVLPSSTEKIFAHCHLSLKNEKEWFNKTIKINKIEPIFPKINP